MPPRVVDDSRSESPEKKRKVNHLELQGPHVNSKSEKYVYVPLKDSEIRIAEIYPASNETQKISCRLVHVQRDDENAYHALSYCWGNSPSLDGRIYIEEIEQLITLTLEKALRSLRYKDKRLLRIWVDAICINQDDNEEKADQVTKMRQVYQNAEQVSAWLGSHSKKDNSKLAWKLIKDLHSHRNDPEDMLSFIRNCKRDQFDALTTFFRREYWWRIWVVQEINSAKCTTVFCDRDHISWSELEDVVDSISKARDNIREHIYHHKPHAVFTLMDGGPKKLKATRNSKMPLNDDELPSLFDLLHSHMSKLSTLPVDKIYGVVGLSRDQASFKVDYDRGPRSTFIYTAWYIISSTRKLSVICLQQNDDNPLRLPSWVPDWVRRLPHPRHRIIGLHIRKPRDGRFAASSSRLADTEWSHNLETLTVLGFVVDTITTAAQGFYAPIDESDIGPTLAAFYDWWKIFVGARGSSPDDCAVFQRTFCGGTWVPHYQNFEHEDPSQRLTLFFELLYKTMPRLMEGEPPIPLPSRRTTGTFEELEKRPLGMVAAAALRMHSKRLVLSERKLTGLAPVATRVGDKIVVLFGCDFPVVLREIGEHWILIGEIYVDGIMGGEAMEGLRNGEFEEQRFDIH